MRHYVERLLGGPYDGKLILYLDMVGKIHPEAAGNPQLQIPGESAEPTPAAG